MARHVISTESELFELSGPAAALSITLSGEESGDKPMKVFDGRSPPSPMTSTKLAKILSLLERMAACLDGARFRADNVRLSEKGSEMLDTIGITTAPITAQLLGELCWLHCPVPANLLALRMGLLVQGMTADELQGTLHAQADFTDAADQAIGANESLFTSVEEAEKKAERETKKQAKAKVSLARFNATWFSLDEEVRRKEGMKRRRSMWKKKIKRARRRMWIRAIMLGRKG